MGTGILAKLFGFFALIFVACASNSGQHMLFGEFHSWSWTSPATLTFGTLGLGCGMLAARFRDRHERRTQPARDEEAAVILRNIEKQQSQVSPSVGNAIRPNLELRPDFQDFAPRTSQASAFSPVPGSASWSSKYVAILLLYAGFTVVTIGVAISDIREISNLAAILALAMAGGLFGALSARTRWIYRVLGGISMAVHVAVGFFFILGPLTSGRDQMIVPFGAIYLVLALITVNYISKAKWMG
jgi:hypothetical protein